MITVLPSSLSPTGCGNGGLDWETQVQPQMEKYLKGLPISVFIHLVDQAGTVVPEHQDIKAIRKWLRDEPESLAFTEVWDDLRSVLDDTDEFIEIGNDRRFSARMTEDLRE